MQHRISAFLKMFDMELEDLHEDIGLLIEKYRDAHDHEVISNYVFYENLALMSNEMFGIDSFREEVRQIDPDRFQNTCDLIETLKQQLADRCRKKGIASAALILAERKMAKILAYIEKQPAQPVPLEHA